MNAVANQRQKRNLDAWHREAESGLGDGFSWENPALDEAPASF